MMLLRLFFPVGKGIINLYKEVQLVEKSIGEFQPLDPANLNGDWYICEELSNALEPTSKKQKI